MRAAYSITFAAGQNREATGLPRTSANDGERMPRQFTPSVRPEVFELRSDYCALSIVAERVQNAPRHPASDEVIESARAAKQWPAWGDAHLDAWRAAYRGFGAKPQRTPSSAEALARRLQGDGQLPTINAVVDLYNALSVRFAIPIGGENIAAYAGDPMLKRATGRETFDTVKDGSPCVEIVPAGEVVWADELGVTCRRWNWRQGLRTRIDAATTRMWFVLERLEPMPMPALLEAGDLLAATLRIMSPGAAIASTVMNSAGATPHTGAPHADRPFL
jgi:DNA/RNA-binding domain of Phe-tRNA-synthetase-like protein